jgi:acetolactate synthase-1/2/3 large subunit
MTFTNPDWLMLAKAFGWHGHYCDRSADLAATLDAAFNEPGPSLVAMPVDYRENDKLTERLGNIACAI